MFLKKRLFIFALVLMMLFISMCTVTTFAEMSDEAELISVNSKVVDNLPTGNTVRYYKFELPEPGKVYLSFEHKNLEDIYIYWEVTMFDSLENEVLKLESKGRDTTSKTMNAYIDKGTYYIRVLNPSRFAAHSKSNYTLCVNYTENKGEYEIEPNYNWELATEIPEINKPITGNIKSSGDVDFYKITLPNPGKVNLGFNHSNIEKSFPHWKITMFDSTENEVLYYESDGTSTTGKSENAYLDAGTYYIRVTSYTSYVYSNVDYSLCVNFTEYQGEYEIEPNNSMEEASLIIDLNEPITGNLRHNTDKDYYKFSMPFTGKVNLVFNHSNLESWTSHWKIALFDTKGNKIYEMDSAGTDTELKSKDINLQMGIYYVRVEPWSIYSHRSVDYTLTIKADNYFPIKVLLNGKRIIFDQQPIIDNGRTLVPLRAIFEAMNATVSWDDKTKTVTAQKGDIAVVMVIGNNTMTKNGNQILLDVPPQIFNGRTLVPARAVAESFGAKVDWDANTRTVIITQ